MTSDHFAAHLLCFLFFLRWTARQIKRMHPKLNIEIVEIKSLGDKVTTLRRRPHSISSVDVKSNMHASLH